MEREQAVRLTQNLLRKMVERNGSDLFITAEFPPAIKVDGTILITHCQVPVSSQEVHVASGGVGLCQTARERDGGIIRFERPRQVTLRLKLYPALVFDERIKFLLPAIRLTAPARGQRAHHQSQRE